MPEPSDPILDAIEETVAEYQDSLAEEQPETPDEEPEEFDDEVDEDEDLDESEESDEDELEEEDDDLEDEESDEEESEEEDEGEEDDEDEEPVALDDETEVELPDGSKATLKDLREGYLRHSDYTKKTQEVAAMRQKVQQTAQRLQEYVQQRADNPVAWAAEIANGTDDPSETLAGVIGQSTDIGGMFAQTVRHLVESGQLPKQMVEALNLTDVAEQAKSSASESRIERLERQLEERDQREKQTREEQAQQQEILAEFDSQWERIKENEGLEYEDPDSEFDEKIDLMRFAYQRGTDDLELAYAARKYMSSTDDDAPTKAKRSKRKKGASKKAEDALKRKRKSSAMSRKPTGGPSPKPRKGPTSYKDAAREAAAELGVV